MLKVVLVFCVTWPRSSRRNNTVRLIARNNSGRVIMRQLANNKPREWSSIAKSLTPAAASARDEILATVMLLATFICCYILAQVICPC